MLDLNKLDLVGTIVDEKFEVVELIGRGGMGAVFKAKQIGLDRIVALKILTEQPDDEASIRFARESEILANMQHPNIARCYTYGLWQSRYPYFAMEYLKLTPLSAMLADGKKLDWQTTMQIGIQVARALGHAHASGVIHRDLSARNVMIDASSTKPIVKVIDFGLATCPVRHEQNLTQTGFLIGTPHYMSPEICVGKKVDERSDFYSLGCILYQCLAGTVPFDSDAVLGIAYKHANEAPPPLTQYCSVPKVVEDVVMEALAKEPSARYLDAKAFETAMLEALKSTANVVSQAKPIKSRNPAVLIALAAAALLSVGAATFITQRHQNAPASIPGPSQTLLPWPYWDQFSRDIEDKRLSADDAVVAYEEYEKHHKADLEANPGAYSFMLAKVAEVLRPEDPRKLRYAIRAIPQLKKQEDALLIKEEAEKNLADKFLLHHERTYQGWFRAQALRIKFFGEKGPETIPDAVECLRLAADEGHENDMHDVHLELARRLALAGRVNEAVDEYLKALNEEHNPIPSLSSDALMALIPALKNDPAKLSAVEKAYMNNLKHAELYVVLAVFPEDYGHVHQALLAIQSEAATRDKELAEQAKTLDEHIEVKVKFLEQRKRG